MLRKSRSKQSARGAVTVEFALTAPFLFMIVLGSIEISRANMLLHSTTVAATEAVRRGIIPGATAAEVEATARQELSYVGIAHADVLVSPAVISDDTTVVSVGISVPINATNGYLIPRFFLGKSLEKVVSLPREAKRDADTTKSLKEAEKAMREALKEAAKAAKEAAKLR
jgi:hypothetical protein